MNTQIRIDSQTRQHGKSMNEGIVRFLLQQNEVDIFPMLSVLGMMVSQVGIFE